MKVPFPKLIQFFSKTENLFFFHSFSHNKKNYELLFETFKTPQADNNPKTANKMIEAIS